MKRSSAVALRLAVFGCGAGLIVLGGFADALGLGTQPGMAAAQAAAIAIGTLMLAGLLVPHAGFRYAVYLVVIGYVLLEAGATGLYLADVIEPETSIWAFEDSGKTIQFDPIRGYRLTPVPSRFTRVTLGTIEYVGVLRGNNQGFPDRDDFHPERDPRFKKRFAVFGDSFTAAQYLALNWPDRVEDLTRERGQPIQLLNFSLDGGGLANWWSILTRIVEADGYQIDGVIFAVIPGDLRRTFSIVDHRGAARHMFARIPSWDPAKMPASLQEAQAHLRPTYGSRVLSAEQFDGLLSGRWKPGPDKRWHPYLTERILRKLFPPATSSLEVPFSGAIPLMKDVLRSTRAMGVPVLVVHVPLRRNLLQPKPGAGHHDTLDFADLLQATYLNGALPFENKAPEEIRAMWLPYDGHWGQKGSDHFAGFMADFLLSWP